MHEPTTTAATEGIGKVKVLRDISGFFGHAGWFSPLFPSLLFVSSDEREGEAGDKKKKAERTVGINTAQQVTPEANGKPPPPTVSRPPRSPTVETKGEIYRGMPVRESHRV